VYLNLTNLFFDIILKIIISLECKLPCHTIITITNLLESTTPSKLLTTALLPSSIRFITSFQQMPINTSNRWDTLNRISRLISKLSSHVVQRNYNKLTRNKPTNMVDTNKEQQKRATKAQAKEKARTMHKSPRERTPRVLVPKAKFAISLREELLTFLRYQRLPRQRGRSTRSHLITALTVPPRLATMNMKAPIMTNHVLQLLRN
jgi:hypothetical protein